MKFFVLKPAPPSSRSRSQAKFCWNTERAARLPYPSNTFRLPGTQGHCMPCPNQDAGCAHVCQQRACRRVNGSSVTVMSMCVCVCVVCESVGKRRSRGPGHSTGTGGMRRSPSAICDTILPLFFSSLASIALLSAPLYTNPS